jgi:hypothetical protein
MGLETIIKKALACWSSDVAGRERVRSHLATSQLYDFVFHHLSEQEESVTLAHLPYCPACRSDLKVLLRSTSEAEIWDFALPQAAASGRIEQVIRVHTEMGKYTITLRPGISPNTPVLITVEINDLAYRKRLEGRTIYVRDGKERSIVQGVITQGEVSRWLEQPLDNVDLTRLTIESQ